MSDLSGETWLDTGFPVQTFTLKEAGIMLALHPETVRQECVKRGIGYKVLGRWRLTQDHIESLMEDAWQSEKSEKHGTMTFRSVDKEFAALLARATGS